MVGPFDLGYFTHYPPAPFSSNDGLLNRDDPVKWHCTLPKLGKRTGVKITVSATPPMGPWWVDAGKMGLPSVVCYWLAVAEAVPGVAWIAHTAWKATLRRLRACWWRPASGKRAGPRPMGAWALGRLGVRGGGHRSIHSAVAPHPAAQPHPGFQDSLPFFIRGRAPLRSGLDRHATPTSSGVRHTSHLSTKGGPSRGCRSVSGL